MRMRKANLLMHFTDAQKIYWMHGCPSSRIIRVHALHGANSWPAKKYPWCFLANQIAGILYNPLCSGCRREFEGVERELVTQQTRRMVLEDQLLDCQRKLYRVEKDAHQLRSGKAMLALKVDELKAKLCEHGRSKFIGHLTDTHIQRCQVFLFYSILYCFLMKIPQKYCRI